MADRRTYLQANTRSSSVPAKPKNSSVNPPPSSAELAANLLATHRLMPANRSDSSLAAAVNRKEAKGIDLMAHLQRSEASIVKTRTGSVLSRGFILKTDHYPSG